MSFSPFATSTGLITVFGALTLLGGCRTTATTDLTPVQYVGGEIVVEGTNYKPPFSTESTNVLMQAPRTETFAVGDTVVLNVLNVDSVSGSFPVDSDGTVDLPFIGPLLVLGKTAGDVRKEVKAQYERDYLNDPIITLGRESAILGQFVIDGWVAKPGIYDMMDGITLQQAVAKVGGITDFGNSKRVLLVRQVGTERVTMLYDLMEIRGNGSPDPIIFPGDIVFVDENAARRTWRDVIQTSPLIALFSRL